MTHVITRVIDCWVFRRSAEGLLFLIMKRAPERIYEGIYHCVHGKIRPGEAAWQAALREMEEETELRPVRLWIADGISAFYEAKEDRMNLVPVFAAEVTSETVIQGNEHSGYEWLPLQEAVNRVAWQNHKNSLMSIARMMTEDFEEKKWLEISLGES